MIGILSWPNFFRGLELGSFRWGRLKVFVDVGVREAAIVQMDTELRCGDGASRKEGANRFKDHLMLRFEEIVLAEGLDKFLAPLAWGLLVA
jgi:hypothetical protein